MSSKICKCGHSRNKHHTLTTGGVGACYFHWDNGTGKLAYCGCSEFSEEITEIEIDITGWWAIFDNDKTIAVFKSIDDIPVCMNGYPYKQITRKVDFAKVNEALKVRGLA